MCTYYINTCTYFEELEALSHLQDVLGVRETFKMHDVTEKPRIPQHTLKWQAVHVCGFMVCYWDVHVLMGNIFLWTGKDFPRGIFFLTKKGERASELSS